MGALGASLGDPWGPSVEMLDLYCKCEQKTFKMDPFWIHFKSILGPFWVHGGSWDTSWGLLGARRAQVEFDQENTYDFTLFETLSTLKTSKPDLAMERKA
jgi:hypothetical protein